MGRQFARRSLSQSSTGASRVVTLSFTELTREVRAQLNQSYRYAHSVRVARAAELLAQLHGCDPSKARLAGMLHDVARLYPPQRLLDECALRGLSIDAFEREHPIVLHARLGAELARERFGVEDPAVLSAIVKHTLGDAGMSALDCVVYLADALEPGRSYPERARLWELAQQDLHDAMRAALAFAIDYYVRKGLPIAPQTAAALRAFNPNLRQAQPFGKLNPDLRASDSEQVASFDKLSPSTSSGSDTNHLRASDSERVASFDKLRMTVTGPVILSEASEVSGVEGRPDLSASASERERPSGRSGGIGGPSRPDLRGGLG